MNNHIFRTRSIKIEKDEIHFVYTMHLTKHVLERHVYTHVYTTKSKFFDEKGVLELLHLTMQNPYERTVMSDRVVFFKKFKRATGISMVTGYIYFYVLVVTRLDGGIITAYPCNRQKK